MSLSTRNVVAIDTSGSFCGVAIRLGSGFVSSLSSAGSGDHFEQLPQMLERVCGEAGIAPSGLHEVRIGLGPGSFTGLRIGMSFAKGLAWSLRVPLVGASSFSGIATAALARDLSLQRVVVVADARRDEFFAGVFRRGAPVEEEVSPRIVPISECLSAPWSVQGTVWVTPQRDFVVDGLHLTPESDGAKGLVSLKPDVERGFSVEEMAVLEPTYLRAVAAKTIEERRLGT